MKKRFRQEELDLLRYNIPIDNLICNILAIPSQKSGEKFRFRCPLCHGFNTSTNPKTNLARCFQCLKNFNTIDLVMLCRKSSFVDTVNFLKQCYCSQANISAPKRKNASTNSNGELEQVNDILLSIVRCAYQQKKGCRE